VSLPERDRGAELRVLRPLRLAAIFVERIWGARSLAPLYPDAAANVGAGSLPIGEVWLTGNECKIIDAPFAGVRLADAWREMSAEWAGTAGNTGAAFPLLVKFLFPEQKLSVQVHPDDEYAHAHEGASGGTGKTEMWYVVSARADAEVFVGLRDGVTAETFRRAIGDGSVEDCLRKFSIAAGDAIFVPAGTAHTIGPGSVLCEIQENSDLTYRVFDYNRKNPDGSARELHVEKAMAVLNFGEQRGGKVRGAIALADAHGEEILRFVACKYFAAERWNFVEAADLRCEPEHFEIWIVVSGSGKISWGAPHDSGAARKDAFDYLPGQVMFIPAGLGRWSIEPVAPSAMIRAFVPDLHRYAKELAERGVSAEDAARVIHR
jgi:mannose-6-phosphate isomerase